MVSGATVAGTAAGSTNGRVFGRVGASGVAIITFKTFGPSAMLEIRSGSGCFEVFTGCWTS